MELEVLKEKDMDLLSRKRVTLLVKNKGATPSRQDMLKEVAKKYKVSEDLVIIKHLYQQFGKTETKLIVNIYYDKEKMAMFEHGNLLKKHVAPAKPVEAAEKPAEAAVEEPSDE